MGGLGNGFLIVFAAHNLEAKTIEDQKAFRSILKTLMQNESKAKKYLMRISMLESLRDAENKKTHKFSK